MGFLAKQKRDLKKSRESLQIRHFGIGYRFDHHAINDVAISTKPVETG